MAHVPYVPDDEAGSRLSRLYEQLAGPEGVDNILRVHSLNPASMEHHAVLYAHLMRGPSPLTRVQREVIAVAVSGANDCFY